MGECLFHSVERISFALLLLAANLSSATAAHWTVVNQPTRLVNGSPVLFRVTTPTPVRAVSANWLGHAIDPLPEPDFFVEEGDTITVGSIVLEVLFTPGHSLGHVSYVCHNSAVVFCGDTLFKGTVGRTDIPGSDPDVLRESILSKLMPLYDDYTVACGHGRTTTIGQERNSNPYLLAWNGL